METEVQENFFDSFESLSVEVWKDKIEKELKGKKLEEIYWNTEGMNLPPFFRNDVESEFPTETKIQEYIRSGLKASWKIQQSFLSESSNVNQDVLTSLAQNCSSIQLIGNEINFASVLKDVHPEMIHLYFSSPGNENVLAFKHFIEENAYQLDSIKGGLMDSPIHYLIDQKSTEKEWKDWLAGRYNMTKNLRNFKSLKIDGRKFEESGASCIQQIAYSAAQGNAYLELLSDDFPIDDLSATIFFDMAVGNSYFLEIAKLRALRIVWAKIISAYQPKHDCSSHTYVMTSSSKLLLGVQERENNIVRNCIAGMIAAIGNSDEIQIIHHDEKRDSNSGRWARNIQNLLQEESYFNQVSDVSMGSHYIDNLTYSIVRGAWDLFMKIQINGGFHASIQKNYIQKEIANAAQRKVDSFNQVITTRVGENKYLNPSSSISSHWDVITYQNEDWMDLPKIVSKHAKS